MAGTISKDIALGVTASTVSLPVSFAVMRGVEKWMSNWGIQAAGTQATYRLFESINLLGNSIVKGVLKASFIFYVVILVPVIEEWFFRGYLYKKQEASQRNKPATLFNRAARIGTNALIFGLFHYSFLLGAVNIPIVIVSTIAGVGFAFLREYTGSWRAPTISHSLNNTIVFLKYSL